MRYSRHQTLSGFSSSSQTRLRRTRALLIGVGGLGCPVATYLTAAGIGHLTINDFDTVDETNLARQPLFCAQDIGQAKADVAKRQLKLVNPEVEVQAHTQRLQSAQLKPLIEQSDFVVDATDNVASRQLIHDCAQQSRRPLVFGAAVRWEGHYAVMRFDLEAGSGSESLPSLLSASDEQLGDCDGIGVFGPLVGVIGTAMANEALKLAIGQGDPGKTVTLFDARIGQWRQIQRAGAGTSGAANG